MKLSRTGLLLLQESVVCGVVWEGGRRKRQKNNGAHEERLVAGRFNYEGFHQLQNKACDAG